MFLELSTTGLEKILTSVHVGSEADKKEVGDIPVCEASSIIAHTGPTLSENAVTQYASLDTFAAQ